ncbi:MAG: hypothetical protein HYS38_09885 [Acidobacteria bacterium]|nr:hypothetical protein [Acidobacteriota bacterium]
MEDSSAFHAALLHPNHLIYTAVGYLNYTLLHAVGLTPRALTVLQVTNSLLSALAAWLLYTILLECSGSAYRSGGLTLLFSLSATWWKFSTDANSYVPSVLLLLLGLRWLLPWRQSRPLPVAIVHTVSMLFHQLAILFYPVVLVGLLLQNRSASARGKAGVVLPYSVLALVLTVGSYLFAFYWQQGSLDGMAFLGWVTSRSPEVSFSFDTWSNTLYSLQGHLRLFLGGRMAMVLAQRNPVTVGLALLLVVLVSAFVLQVWKHAGDLTALRAVVLRPDSRFRPLIVLLAAWIISYLVFLFFWLPGNTFYRLFYLPALILLAGVILAQCQVRLGKARRYRLALLVGAVAVFNLTFYILPYSRVAANPPLEFALKMNPVWDQGTMVYYGTFITDDWTIRYFNPKTSWRPLDPRNLAAVEKELRGGNVWLDTTALDLLSSRPEGREWLSAHLAADQRYELASTGHRIIFQKIVPDSSGALH